MTTFLSGAQVLFIHHRLIEETGGSHGVRDVGLLQSALARPQSEFEGKELYPDLVHKAAALVESLIRNHPFIDGNKRCGIAAAGLFLLANGFRLEAGNPELEAFVQAVAEGRSDIESIAAWFDAHIVPSGETR